MATLWIHEYNTCLFIVPYGWPTDFFPMGYHVLSWQGEECGGLFAVHGSVLPCWVEMSLKPYENGKGSWVWTSEFCPFLFLTHFFLIFYVKQRRTWNTTMVSLNTTGSRSDDVDAEQRYTFQIMGLLLDVLTLELQWHGCPWSYSSLRCPNYRIVLTQDE